MLAWREKKCFLWKKGKFLLHFLALNQRIVKLHKSVEQTDTEKFVPSWGSDSTN